MVMGDRIKPGAVKTVGNVKETTGETRGNHGAEADAKTGEVKGDDTAGAAVKGHPQSLNRPGRPRAALSD